MKSSPRQQNKQALTLFVLRVLDNSRINPEEDIDSGCVSHRRLLSEAEGAGFTRSQLSAALESLLNLDVIARKKWNLDQRQWLYWQCGPLIRCAVAQGPRSRVEDSYGFQNHRLVVCDGMGGHEAGDLAAQCMVELALVSGFSVARKDCQAVVKAQAGHNAGTTFSGIELDGDVMRWLHCGDSALWVLVVRGDETAFRRLTPDQSRWGRLRSLNEIPATRNSKSRLDSCVIGGRSSMACPPPMWCEGTLDLKEQADDASVWIFGTTDGFHEAYEHLEDAQDGTFICGDVDEVWLGAELHRLTIASSYELREAVRDAAEKVKDNATLVMWKVR